MDSVRQRFFNKFGREASPTIEKCLKELKEKTKVSL